MPAMILPSGKSIEVPNLPPKGTSKESIMKGLIANGLATPEDFNLPNQPSAMDKTLGAIETGANIISGMVAEPIAGLTGMAVGALPNIGGLEQGDAAKAVETVRSGLTYQPRTEVGQSNQQAIGEALAPVGEAMQGAEQYLGDKTFEATGSPTLAAAAQTIPTIGMQALGMGASKALTKAAQAKNVNKAVAASAPSIEQIETASRNIYKTLDKSGAKINDDAFLNLAAKIENTASGMGHDVDVTPTVQGVLNRLEKELGKSHSVSDLETLRKVAQNAAKSTNTAEQAIGNAIIGDIDDFFDSLKAKDLIDSGTVTPEKIGPMYKNARDLWGRKRRSELIEDAVEKAKDVASGEENGIRIEFRKILNSKKQSKFFSEAEKKEMKRVVQGSTGANIAKFIGKFGYDTKNPMNILGGSIGAGAGATIGGPAGAVAVPLIGSVSKAVATKLTKGNARFADDVIRAGKDSKKIAEAYLKYTPKAEQSAQELTELFIAKKIPSGELQKLQQSKIKPISDAAIFAAPVIKQMEEEQAQPEGLTIDVQQGFQDKQVEPMQDPQSMMNNAKQIERQSIIESANKSVMDKADTIATAYKVPVNRAMGIDLAHVASLPPYVGTQLLREINPQTAPINEAIIRLAHGNPENRQAVKMVKNVLQNNGMLLPDSVSGSIQSMVNSGIKPEKAVQLATSQKTIKPQEAKKIAELIRGKLSPDIIKDFAPLLSSIEALA